MRPSATATPSSDRTSQLERRQRRAAAAVRYSLGTLLAFAALNAFAGGYYGLAGAKGVPKEWLRGSAFPDYFVPSLILVVIVGGSFLLATVAVFARWRHDRLLATAAAVIVFGWLAVQVAIIGYLSWMQPATAIGAALVLMLARRLPSPTPPARLRRRTT
jgi:peptidoglycan/LPS O-acetylase OafA/YrhL